MPKEYTFTAKHYPTNDLYELDLEEHMNQMAKVGWELVSTEQLIHEHNSKTPLLLFFWGKEIVN